MSIDPEDICEGCNNPYDECVCPDADDVDDPSEDNFE